MDVAERFWAKVERRGYDECWPWRASTPQGYGSFRLSPGQLGVERGMYGAHRVAFRLVHGRWPDPEALHGCDFKGCCNAFNPAHIHEGTHAENMAEVRERGLRKLWDDSVRAEVRELYLTTGLSQREVAARVGIPYQTVAKIVCGLGSSARAADGTWCRAEAG